MPEKKVTRVEFPNAPQVEEKKTVRKRVAAYARVSTERDKQENSLRAQKDYFRKYIKTNPEWVYVGLYVDDGISGLSAHKREGFLRMVADALDGKIDMIITKSLSRFARNTVDSLITIRKLKAKGIAVYFQKENINTLDVNGEFLITLMSSFAEEESRSISENVTWAVRHRFAQGDYWISFEHFLGYKRGDNGSIIIDEDEARVVRFIYMLALEGRCCDDIRKILTENEILSPAGNAEWQRITVVSILSNVKYKGDARLQKRFTVDFLTKKTKINEGEIPQYYVKNGHPAIIREDAWEEVQTIIASREQWNHSMGGLTNKIVCGDCGGLYGRKIWHSTTTHDVVWECNNRKAGRTKCCCCHIYDEKLNEATEQAMRHLLQLYPDTLSECDEISTAFFGGRLDLLHTLSDGITFDDSAVRVLINSVKVSLNQNLVFHFLDGHSFRFPLRSQTPHGRPGKSERECTHGKINELYRVGHSAKEIADVLGVSIHTVRGYLRRTGNT